MKISTQLQFDRAAGQMGKLTQALAEQQAKISSGKAFTAAREAPVEAATLLRLDALRADQEAQFKALDQAEARSGTQEVALRSASDVLVRIKELAIQAANDTYSEQDRELFALEVRALTDQLLNLANAQDAEGNAVFAGARTSSAAFERDALGVVRYLGDSTRITVPTGASGRLTLARPGTEFFAPQPDPEDPDGPRVAFFAGLDAFAVALENNSDALSDSLATLDGMIDTVSLGLAKVGTDLAAVESQRGVLSEEALQTEALISEVRDLDFAEAITKLRADQLALEAAQSSFARITGRSLFDFLR